MRSPESSHRFLSSCPAQAGHPVRRAAGCRSQVPRNTGSPAFAGDDINESQGMDKTQPHPLFKLATELGPLLVFFFVNAKFNLFAATGAFMVAIVAAMIASYVVTRHIPIMAIVTGVIVLVFGTLTLVLHDETFIKVKPTIIYGLFAAILGGGLLFGRSFIAVMFDQMFNLTPQGWRILTLRWALFFAGMAVLNEIVWRTQSTDFWVNFKVFGVTPITMIFAIAQMPLTKRYHLEPVSLEASEADAGDVRKG
ncbi:bll0472 [Bradyrhizobium diazoefficiens USDA 110]|nr:bll0472 [Bradyrhizobium diazoefficiens USDA 110]